MVSAHETRGKLTSWLAAGKIRVPLLAVLVTLNLLVFHGTLGSMSRSVSEPTSTAAHQVAELEGTSASYLAEHSPSHAYFYLAALCALVLGSFVGLFFRGVRRRQRFVFPRSARQRFDREMFFDGLRPTPPLLQVFRL